MTRRPAIIVVVVLLLTSACGAPAGNPVIASDESVVVSADLGVTSTSVVGDAGAMTRPDGLEEFGAGRVSGTATELDVLVADDSDAWRQGLMNVSDLGEWDGMWFAFDDDRDSGFWMKDTPLPLSIAWIDAAGVVVATADMTPCDEEPCPVYLPGAVYRHALEVAQGDLARFGISIGTQLTLALG